MKKEKIINKRQSLWFPISKLENVRSKKLSKWGDVDLDGTPNKFDCNPRKANKDNALEFLKSKISALKPNFSVNKQTKNLDYNNKINNQLSPRINRMSGVQEINVIKDIKKKIDDYKKYIEAKKVGDKIREDRIKNYAETNQEMKRVAEERNKLAKEVKESVTNYWKMMDQLRKEAKVPWYPTMTPVRTYPSGGKLLPTPKKGEGDAFNPSESYKKRLRPYYEADLLVTTTAQKDPIIASPDYYTRDNFAPLKNNLKKQPNVYVTKEPSQKNRKDNAPINYRLL